MVSDCIVNLLGLVFRLVGRWEANWDDAHAGAILTGCARAAAPRGVVIVIEAMRGHAANTAIDLFMMMCFGGRERTVDDLAQLAVEGDRYPRL